MVPRRRKKCLQPCLIYGEKKNIEEHKLCIPPYHTGWFTRSHCLRINERKRLFLKYNNFYLRTHTNVLDVWHVTGSTIVLHTESFQYSSRYLCNYIEACCHINKTDFHWSCLVLAGTTDEYVCYNSICGLNYRNQGCKSPYTADIKEIMGS